MIILPLQFRNARLQLLHGSFQTDRRRSPRRGGEVKRTGGYQISSGAGIPQGAQPGIKAKRRILCCEVKGPVAFTRTRAVEFEVARGPGKLAFHFRVAAVPTEPAGKVA